MKKALIELEKDAVIAGLLQNEINTNGIKVDVKDDDYNSLRNVFGLSIRIPIVSKSVTLDNMENNIVVVGKIKEMLDEDNVLGKIIVLKTYKSIFDKLGISYRRLDISDIPMNNNIRLPLHNTNLTDVNDDTSTDNNPLSSLMK